MTAMAARVVERNVMRNRKYWYAVVAGAAEPFLFLFSVGVGVGALIAPLAGPGGELVEYRAFVAPGMLAAATMNTAIFDASIFFFVKVKYLNVYDTMLASPLSPRDIVRGELVFSTAKIGFYATCFVVTMWVLGLLRTPWAVLLVPTAVLIGVAFATVGMWAATAMRSWVDFELVFVATIPMFLFSATFFPLSRYPEGVQWLVRLTPLYHGADLLRRLALGGVGWGQLVSAAYLGAIALIGLRMAERRVEALLRP
ncbi:MAG: ABC transporter permease [Actinomycetota bacterium]